MADEANDDDEAVKTGSFAFPAPPCRAVSTDPLILNTAGRWCGAARTGRHAGNTMGAEQQAVAGERSMARRMDAAEAVAAKAASEADPGDADRPPAALDATTSTASELRGGGYQRPGGAPSAAVNCTLDRLPSSVCT